MDRIVGAVCANFIFVMLLPLAHAQSQSGLQLSFSVACGYDTNIVGLDQKTQYQNASNHKNSDVYVNIGSHLSYEFVRELLNLSTNYDVLYHQYINNDSLSNFSQNFGVATSYHPSEVVNFSLADSIKTSPYGKWSPETDSLTGDSYYTNFFKSGLTLNSRSGAFSLGFNYTNQMQRWQEVAGRNSLQNSYRGNFGVAFRNYIHFNVSLTYTEKEFSQSFGQYENISGGLGMNYTIPDIIGINVDLNVSNRQQTVPETQTVFFHGALSVNKEFPVAHVEFSLRREINDSDVHIGNYYLRTGATMMLSTKIRERYNLSFRTEYFENEYQELGLVDQSFRVGPGIGLKFVEWLSINLDYNYTLHHSSTDKNSYETSRVDIKITISKVFKLIGE